MSPVKKTTKKITKRAPKASAEKAVSPASEMKIFSMQGKEVGSIALPEKIFSTPWRSDLVHQVVTAMQANARQNRAHTKERAEVAGGGRKPWKQKGTGQARHGSSRSPIWRHGGVTFGPRKERDYHEKINRKMKVGALLSVLSQKAKDGEIILVSELSFEAPKTKTAKNMMANLAKAAEAQTLVTKKENSALLALAARNQNAMKSFRNFGNVMTEEVRNLNPVDVLSHKYLIIENPKESFAILSSRAKSRDTK